MFDVCALGELLIDFTPAGISLAGNLLFERNPGGAPVNMLTTVTKLGGRGHLWVKQAMINWGNFKNRIDGK